MPPQQEVPHHNHNHENRLAVQIERFPAELHAYPQWVCWRYVPRGADKKPDKQPVNPHNLHNAGVHWTNTWSTSEHAYAIYLEYVGQGIDGVGFVLTKGDPFVGVDVDNCVQDRTLAESVQQVVEHLRSYTEISPSGQGLRILVACPEFSDNIRTESLEIYSHSRFLTVTGQHLAGTPGTISRVQREAIQVLIPPKFQETLHSEQSKAYGVAQGRDAITLWERIFQHDQYGSQHLRRFQGDLSLDRGDHSFAVIRLLNCLARWTDGDAKQMRDMMLVSPLANEKWLSRRGTGDWLDHQIADAIRFTKKGR